MRSETSWLGHPRSAMSARWLWMVVWTNYSRWRMDGWMQKPGRGSMIDVGLIQAQHTAGDGIVNREQFSVHPPRRLIIRLRVINWSKRACAHTTICPLIGLITVAIDISNYAERMKFPKYVRYRTLGVSTNSISSVQYSQWSSPVDVIGAHHASSWRRN